MKEAASLSALLDRCPDAEPAWRKLGHLFAEVVTHHGFGDIRIDVRWLSKGRKEIVLSSGKQYRYVISNLPTPDLDEEEEEKGGSRK